MDLQGKDGQAAGGAGRAAGARAHPVRRLCQVARHVAHVPPPRPPLRLIAAGPSAEATACRAAELSSRTNVQSSPQRDGTALPQRQELGRRARCPATALQCI